MRQKWRLQFDFNVKYETKWNPLAQSVQILYSVTEAMWKCKDIPWKENLPVIMNLPQYTSNKPLSIIMQNTYSGE